MTRDADRQGPRPLALHAYAAWRAHMLAAMAPAAPEHVDPAAATLLEGRLPDPMDRLALSTAVMAEMSGRWSAFWDGVAKYRAHPFRRAHADRPAIWAAGQARLLDFAPESDGPPVVAIPSLVNSADVLDLLPDRSLMGALAAAGFRPMLLAWGAPEADAGAWTIDRYLNDRLIPMLARVNDAVDRKPIVLGYCMGGLLATALANARPKDVQGLALLATPWDFHAPDPSAAAAIAGLAPKFQAAAQATGAVPTDVLQTLFIALDPTLASRKFRRFAGLDMASTEAELFVAMEDWVNGGPDLAWPVARTVLEGWYGANQTAKGAWKVGGHRITPTGYRGPTLVAAPRTDRIVPPESARAYAAAAPWSTLLDIDAGHVGMIVGHNAEAGLWRPLIQWLQGVAT